MTRNVMHGGDKRWPRWLPVLTRWSYRCNLPIALEIALLSVAWPQKTVKGLGPPGT